MRDPWITQELTQEVFLRVWNSIERFDERRGEFQGWIAAISRNKALDYLRSKNARARRRECPLNKLRDPAKENCLEERIMTEDLVRLSRDVMQQLNEKQRQVFRLTYFEGKTQSEIAAELEAPLGSVKTWARVISKMLRKQGAITPGKVCMCGSI
ncbi:MAG: sigma-70 family RNA polymerase sigma factor [Acidobacteriaceae bacterium]|nr:sigma-70 family RNA polymerase sigma factor [Acidobacteriaceae bacterium]